MRDVIIDTESMVKMHAAIDSMMEPGNSIAGFIVGKGQAGRGKTEAAKQYHASSDASVYIKVRGGWTQTAFLQRLLFEVRGENGDMPKHNGNRCKDLIIDFLDKNKKVIHVDEADRLHIDRIEDLRDVLDEAGVPVVLVGEEGLEGLLAERRRIWSRVIDEIEFGPINAVEVGMYSMQAAGLDIPAGLCKSIADRTDGDFRLVRNMMILLEKAAKAAETFKVDNTILETVIASRSWRRA